MTNNVELLSTIVVAGLAIAILAADVIVEKAGENLILNEAARIACEGRWILLFEAIVIIVPLLKHPRHPAAFVFYRNDLELGISFKNAVMNDLEERVGDIHQL